MKLQRGLIGVVGVGLIVLATQRGLSESPAPTSDFAGLQQKLAQTRVDLAELELRLAHEQNERVPGLVTRMVLDSLEQSLANARARLEQATTTDGSASVQQMRSSAETAVHIAQQRYDLLRDLASRSDAVTKGDVQRAQLRLQIAQLELASLERLHELPLDQQLQWQLSEIDAALDRLHDRVTVLEDKR